MCIALEYKMKKRIKKLLCFSFIAFMSIGVNFDTEARVTREVAEIVLPDLMEHVGIPTTQQTKQHQRAIINMIYTDMGQNQMVQWVEEGIFPENLKGLFENPNSYGNKKYRKISLASMFPCSTGTFTSFANNDVRLGKHTLTKGSQTVFPKFIPNNKESKTFDGISLNINQYLLPIDVLLAKIIFILDILDDPVGLKAILTSQTKLVLNTITSSNTDYTCRPVSAIIAEKSGGGYEGDCVETLYRHLLNIAVQDPHDLSRLHIERLPEQLQKYYNLSKYPENNDDPEGLEIKQKSEAGLTEISKHNEWKKCLEQWIEDNKLHIDISTGSLINLANVLNLAAFFQKIDNFKMEEISLYIQNAMNKLAALQHPEDVRFVVKITSELSEPTWANKQIIITDCHANRQIVIGICEIETHHNKGHAEILNIKPL